MRLCRIPSLIAAALLAIGANGAVNVTASRDYVDRKIIAVSNALDAAISSATPGSYSVVSNNAMNALSRDEAASGMTKWSWRSTGPVLAAIEWRNGRWVGVQDGPEASLVYFDPPYDADANATHLTSNDVTADRTRLPTMKDVEDKASTNDVSTIVTNRTTGVMSGARVFPLARYDYFNDYTCDVGDIVEKDGRLYRCIVSDFGDGHYPWFPVDATYYFEDVTDQFSTNAIVRMYQLSTIDMSSKQDLLPYPTNAIPYAAVNGTPTKLSQFQNDSGFITASTAPVKTVNSKTGNVTLGATDVGAIPQTGMVVNVTSGTMHFKNRLSVGSWPSSYKPINIPAGGGVGFAFGDGVHVGGDVSMALGVGALATNGYSFVWNGDDSLYYLPGSSFVPYASRYRGGFHINPKIRDDTTNPLQNFWIGGTNLNDWIGILSPEPDLSGYLQKAGGEVTGEITFRTSSGLLGGSYLRISKDGIETGVSGTPYPNVFTFPEKSGTIALSEEFDEWKTNENVVIGRNITWQPDGITAIGHDLEVSGSNAVAVGTFASAIGEYAFALGTSDAIANYAYALGFNCFSGTNESFSAGLFSSAHGRFSTVLGYKASVSNEYDAAFGPFAMASGGASTAIGPAASAGGYGSIAYGLYSEANEENGIAIGTQAASSNGNSIAIGWQTTASNASTAIGTGVNKNGYLGGATALGTRGHALGGYVDGETTDGVAIGTSAIVTNNHAVVISATRYSPSAPENRSHGDGTITFGVTNSLKSVFIGTNRLDEVIAANTASSTSNVVTQSYIQQKLGVYLYIGEDGGVYVHTPTNQEEEQ